MHLMVSSAIKFLSVFDAMCTDPYHGKLLASFKLSTTEWDSLKAVIEFLQNACRFTRAASGSSYINLSLSPMIYDALEAQTLEALRNDTSDNGSGESIKVAPKGLFEKACDV